jgi:hypothetical protein
VSSVGAQGLSAAVSALPAAVSAPPVPELLAYGRVVEALSRRQTVVPLRYGCFLDGKPALRHVLAERQDQYRALLKDLEGRVEMGIRILLPAARVATGQEPQPRNGCGYLAWRRDLYGLRETATRQHQDLLERYVQAFAGLHGRHRTETAARAGVVVLSLYSLIPASQVRRFRAAFQALTAPEGPKALISGPWPPYNFVTPEAGEQR